MKAPSLNARVSSRKHSGALDLCEQVHKIRYRSCIELLHNVDDPVAKIFISESFAQPVKLLNRALPRHGSVQPSFVAVLLLHKHTIVFGANRYSGAEFSRIVSAETLVGMNFNAREKRLSIRRLNAQLFQLCGPNLIVEQRGSDKVFEVVVALLFDLWMVLG